MNYDYNIIVIGAGSGGLVVASGASSIGAKVAIIEADKMGGDCLNYGCVPSKSLLRSAHVADLLKHAKDFGLETNVVSVDMIKVTDRVADVIKAIEFNDSKRRYEAMGVDVYEGFGKFVDQHHILINDKIISAENIVIATGSKAFVPPIKGLDKVDYYTNETIFNIKKLPKELIVLGAGPIGCELSQAFAHLGSRVVVVDMLTSLFSKDDIEVGALMKEQFIKDGINLELNARILSVSKNGETIEVIIEREGILQTIKGDSMLVALGRKPNTKNLDLDKVGIELGKKGHVITNDKLQTNVANIYACGDVVGPYAFTHMASYQASIVIQNIIFPIKRKVNYINVPWVTYTKPEVAHVGYTEQQLLKNKIPYKKYFEALSNNDRAKAESDTQGFLKILTNNKGVVIGATMVGEKAGEQIMLANVAIDKKMKIGDFVSIIIPYPTEVEMYKSIGLQATKESYTPWKKRIVKKFFLS
jgi:pyruvate/2-oxoglutarate dehydrogenase complex dihydrolipoamide dehydrogenase (E3) component